MPIAAPVVRGKWVLENLLCAAAPAANVPPLEEQMPA
jgi:hypothetical protein